jgi:hypothetical protein
MKTNTTWLQKSVEDFFGSCSWQGQVLVGQTWSQPGETIPLTASVHEFFLGVPWQGKPMVGSLPKSSATMPANAPIKPAEATLADLLDAF